jgi:hypothetical protein
MPLRLAAAVLVKQEPLLGQTATTLYLALLPQTAAAVAAFAQRLALTAALAEAVAAVALD